MSSHKKHISAKRIAALVILISFVCVSLAMPLYILMHAGHDCGGRLCNLCPCIVTKRTGDDFVTLAVVGLLSAALITVLTRGKLTFRGRKNATSLIDFNVRMNN
jgi:hypothetical protein